MAIQAGRLRERIRIEALGAGSDDYGGESGSWSTLTDIRAQLLNGTGRERREAAQESATAAVTFRVRRSATTEQVTAKHRIRFDPFGGDPTAGGAPVWDISSVVPFERDGIDITATRKE